MALSTCSGQDEGYQLDVWDRFEAGMRELVCFTQHLLEAEADPHAHGKFRERIEAARREMSAAEEQLGRQLDMVDARTKALVAEKKKRKDEQEEKKENLRRLRIQLDSCRRSEREAREMLERANGHLREKQAELQRKRAEADSNRLTRDVGIGLMFIPIVGTIAGSIMVGCGQVALDAAEKAAGEVQDAVNRHMNEVSKYSEEVCRYEEQERQLEAEIAANEQQLAQIDVERQILDASHTEIVTLQNGLRKCVTFMNGLAGRISVAKRLTEDLVIYEELANIFGEIVQQEQLLSHRDRVQHVRDERGGRAAAEERECQTLLDIDSTLSRCEQVTGEEEAPVDSSTEVKTRVQAVSESLKVLCGLLENFRVELAPELGPLENISSEVQRQVSGEDPTEDVPESPKQEDTSVCLLDYEDGECTSDSCQKQEVVLTDRQNNVTDFINLEPEGDIGHWFDSKVRRHKWKIVAAVLLAVPLIAVIAWSVSKASVTPPNSPAACCHENWIGYQSKCYLFSEDEANWTSSQHFCSSHDAVLPWLHTLQEKDFLMQHTGSLDHWIGLRREPGQSWKWPNGSVFNNPFQIGEGGECAYIYKNTISSSRCYIKRSYICSKPDEFAKREMI